MVLESGTPPYDYSVADPLRVRNPYTNIGVQGPSGIFLEQAQFVITAEIRKYDSDSHRLEDYNVYVNPVITPSGPYEPKADGSTLGNLLNPANLFILNHITETRTALDLLFAFYEAETENTEEECRIDWLNKIAPELPFPSGYRRYDPGPSVPPNFVVTSDINTLGGSGTLFDIDFAEVMFNPYPMFSTNEFLDVHILGRFRIVNAPVWPCFQKTDGTLISLNGREPVGIGLSDDYDVSRFTFNELRLDGHVFLPETEYFIGRGLQDFFPDTTLTYVSSSPRTANNGRIFQGSRVFATTTALSSGIYKLAARNTKENVPFTTIPSGLVSIWPPSGQAHPATNGHVFDAIPPFNIRSKWYNNAEYEHGYQVFDDCFWITDHPNGNREPSGLAIASPFTGHALWLQFADLTLSTGSGLAGGAVGSAKSWGSHVGLERVGSTIYRVQEARADGSTAAVHTALIQTYNDDLDYLGQIESVEFNSFPGDYVDMIYLPTLNEWMFYSTTSPGNLGIDFTNDDFTTVLREGSAFYIGAAELTTFTAISNTSRIFGAGELEGITRSPAEFSDGNNSSGFTTRGSGIWDLEIGTPGSGTIFKDCRIIDMSKVLNQGDSASLECKIYDMMEVPVSSTHTRSGAYVLASWSTTTSERLFLLRITARDDATAPGFCVGFWDVLASYDLGTLPSTVSVTINNVPNMLFKDVN